MSMGSGGMYGNGGPFAVPEISGIAPTQLNIPAPKKKGGMFGGGGMNPVLATVLGGLGDYLLQRSGMQPIYAPQMLMKRKQKSEEEQYQRQRQDGMQDWIAKQKWEQENRGPDPLAQMMMQAGIDPASPQGRQMYQQALQNKVNPFTQMRVQNPDGSETLNFVRPPSVPTAPVGGLIPIDDEDGGPRPLGVGGFPRW